MRYIILLLLLPFMLGFTDDDPECRCDKETQQDAFAVNIDTLYWCWTDILPMSYYIVEIKTTDAFGVTTIEEKETTMCSIAVDMEINSFHTIRLTTVWTNGKELTGPWSFYTYRTGDFDSNNDNKINSQDFIAFRWNFINLIYNRDDFDDFRYVYSARQLSDNLYAAPMGYFDEQKK